MPTTVRSFAKINLGLCIGPNRPDKFHELRTVYQTIALHDVLRLQVAKVPELRFAAPTRASPRTTPTPAIGCSSGHDRAPIKGPGNSRHRKASAGPGRIGRCLGECGRGHGRAGACPEETTPAPERLRIAAEVGSDLPLFLVGGTVWVSVAAKRFIPCRICPRFPA